MGPAYTSRPNKGDGGIICLKTIITPSPFLQQSLPKGVAMLEAIEVEGSLSGEQGARG